MSVTPGETNFKSPRFEIPARQREATMTKGEMIHARAIKVLEDAGWVSAGATAYSSFRVGSASAPVYGGMGGSICNVGGGQRYTKPGTNIRVTVGKITTCFYEIVDNAATKHVSIPTSDEDRIRLFATGQMAKGERWTGLT